MSALRGTAMVAGFVMMTVPLMPVQAVLLRLSPSAARRFPHWYHRQVCRLMGIRLQVEGQVDPDRPVLLVCNHSSWLDIPVLSALAPVSFVSKQEIASWPFVSWLAKLQRSVFVDRSRRSTAAETVGELNQRLATGDTIVLFPEGTSSDGNSVLPFKSSLFGAVNFADTETLSQAVVQTAAVVYTHRHGIPMARADRPRIGWYGDMDMFSHAWDVLKSGPLIVSIRVGEPVRFSDVANRKALARQAETAIRRDVLGLLRGRPGDPTLVPVEPGDERRRRHHQINLKTGEKWT